MIEFLTTYNLTNIIVFLIGFFVALQGGWNLYDFFKNKYNLKFDKDYRRKREKETLRKNDQDFKDQFEEMVQLCGELENKINILSDTLESKFSQLDNQIDRLKESDMLDIKQSIVKDYHYFVEEQKWIDDFSLDVLELRFKKYKEEGGNSYIEELMSEIRHLPKHPL